MRHGTVVLALLCILAAGDFAGPDTARAAELCSAIDASLSLSAQDFQLQLEGLAAAVEDPSVIPRTGAVTLSVVVFEWGAYVEIPPTLIDSAATAEAIAGQIRSIPWPAGHRTDIYSAVQTCAALFMDDTQEWIIDISTDGMHSLSLGTDPLDARVQAVAEGVDVVNAIGVGLADMAALEELVWPQPASSPPDQGFTVYVEGFSSFTQAMREKIRLEISRPVAIDIKPGSCPNPFNVDGRGRLPVAILGAEDFDVLQVEPETVNLAGVSPVRWSYGDVAAPYSAGAGRESCEDCGTEGPDGHLDLVFSFDRQEVAAALGEVGDMMCFLLTLDGYLREEYGGLPVSGVDVVRIQVSGND